MIKGNGLYAVNGVYAPTTDAIDEIQKAEPLLLLSVRCGTSLNKCTSSESIVLTSLENDKVKKKRLGRGSNILRGFSKVHVENITSL